MGFGDLDSLLKKSSRENKKSFLIVWNRGLGDIPLSLYALVFRIRHFIPHASVTFLTRPDLALGFEMLDNVHILPCADWKRGRAFDLAQSLSAHQLTPSCYDVTLERIDLERWFEWQIGVLTPKLRWQKTWDELPKKYFLQKGKNYIGVHVNTETGKYYRCEKNWPLACWHDLFSRLKETENSPVILFGIDQKPLFHAENIVDLRGKTSVFDMLSIIKNHCHSLIAPDSGILSLVYYIEDHFPLRILSLWGNPKRGILRQKVASPNRELEHLPLVGKYRDISNISCQKVYDLLFGKIPRKAGRRPFFKGLCK